MRTIVPILIMLTLIGACGRKSAAPTNTETEPMSLERGESPPTTVVVSVDFYNQADVDARALDAHCPDKDNPICAVIESGAVERALAEVTKLCTTSLPNGTCVASATWPRISTTVPLVLRCVSTTSPNLPNGSVLPLKTCCTVSNTGPFNPGEESAIQWCCVGAVDPWCKRDVFY